MESLSANWDAAEESAPEPVETAPEPVEAPPEPVQADGQQGKPMATTSPESAVTRGEKGRFQKVAVKAAVKPTVSKIGEQTAAKPEGDKPPPAVVTKAPASWKPAAKEVWSKMPPEAQQEAARVDREVQRTLQENASLKQFHGAFSQTISPYTALLQSQGADPLKTVGNLLATSYALHTAPVQHKAGIVASIIQQFGIPIEALASALDGRQAPQQQHVPQQQQQAQFRDPRLDQMLAQRQQQVSQSAQADVDAFTAENEFMDNEDFKMSVAFILKSAAEQGRHDIPLERAYEIAKQTDPEIQSILAQREAAKTANAQRASTQRSRVAASSVRSQPAGIVSVSTDRPKSRLDSLSRAWDAAQE